MTNYIQEVEDAINEVFGDMLVGPAVTRERLEELIEFIQVMLDALPDEANQ